MIISIEWSAFSIKMQNIPKRLFQVEQIPGKLKRGIVVLTIAVGIMVSAYFGFYDKMRNSSTKWIGSIMVIHNHLKVSIFLFSFISFSFSYSDAIQIRPVQSTAF